MTKVIARVHPVHLMNLDWAPGGRQPPDQANWLGLWVRWKLAAVIHIWHRHCCYYYSACKLILILLSMEGGRLSRPSHCSKGVQPVPKAVCRSSCCDKHNCLQCDSKLGHLTPQSDVLATISRHCDSLKTGKTYGNNFFLSWNSVSHTVIVLSKKLIYHIVIRFVFSVFRWIQNIESDLICCFSVILCCDSCDGWTEMDMLWTTVF